MIAPLGLCSVLEIRHIADIVRGMSDSPLESAALHPHGALRLLAGGGRYWCNAGRIPEKRNL